MCCLKKKTAYQLRNIYIFVLFYGLSLMNGVGSKNLFIAINVRLALDVEYYNIFLNRTRFPKNIYIYMDMNKFILLGTFETEIHLYNLFWKLNLFPEVLKNFIILQTTFFFF